MLLVTGQKAELAMVNNNKLSQSCLPWDRKYTGSRPYTSGDITVNMIIDVTDHGYKVKLSAH